VTHWFWTERCRSNHNKADHTIMPVPRRKHSKNVNALVGLPNTLLSMLDVNVIFKKTKYLLLWGFTPAVITIGLFTEPRPRWFDLVNIWD